MRIFQYEARGAKREGAPVGRAFLACVVLCMGAALVVGGALPRAYASAPGPGVEASADVVSPVSQPAEVPGGEPILASAVAGANAEAFEDVNVPEGEGVPGDADVAGDEAWKTQLGAWIVESNPDAVDAAQQQARTQAAHADAAAAKAELAAASDRVSAAIALALASLAAGLVMLAVGRAKSRSTR